MIRKGVPYLLGWPGDIITGFFCHNFRHRPFVFQGQRYEYFYHGYNRTWRNEREVELPIVRQIIKDYSAGDILEIGNVLRHYFPCQHDTVDKFEKFPKVINQDIADFKPRKQYRLVVSISTLEHVGWDEKPIDPTKIRRVLRAIRESMLAPGGKLLATLPLGYNTDLDKSLLEDRAGFDRLACLERIGQDNWQEIAWDEAQKRPFHYDQEKHRANLLAVATIG